MGLDLVELTIEVEETFGIKIEDRDAEKIITVGDLYQFVLTKVDVKEPTPCPTSRAFYRLRRALVGACGVPREAVQPSAPVDGLLPGRTRRRQWRRLGATLGEPLPDLRRPRRVEDMLGVLGVAIVLLPFAAAVFTGMFIGSGLAPYAAAVCAFAVMLAVVWLAAVVTRPLATGTGGLTVGGLAASLAASEILAAAPDHRRWTRATVRSALVALIVKILAARPEEVRDDASFLGDLGAS